MSNYAFVHQGRLDLGQNGHFNTAITDLDIGIYNGVTSLFAASRAGGGVAVYDLSGPISLTTSWVDDPDHSLLRQPDLTQLTLGGQHYLTSAGHSGFASTDMATGWNTSDLIGGTTALSMAQISDNETVYVLDHSGTIHGLNGSNPADLTSQTALISGPGSLRSLSEIEGVSIGGTDYLIAYSASANFITTLTTDGSLNYTDLIGTETGLPIAAPSDIHIMTHGDQVLMLVAGAGSDSLSVIEITSDGRLSPQSHVVGNIPHMLDGVQAVDGFTYNDQLFIVAGGAADGLGLFAYLPNGRLQFLTSIQDSYATSLTNVTDIAVHLSGSSVSIFASSGYLEAPSHITLDMSLFGGTFQGGVQTGTSFNDFLIGGDSADVLSGGNGHDYLIDGRGADTLTGGDGQDVFVLTKDGEDDRITDFNIAEDRLDLTDFGVTTFSNLTYAYRGYGADLWIDGERLIIETSNGLGLLPSQFNDSLFETLRHYDVTRAQTELNPGRRGPTVFGTDADETFFGQTAEDEIRSGAGNDTLLGRSGNDALIGGAGADTISGGSGNDRLMGNDDDDVLDGEEGDDLLYGGTGNDILRAGAGTNQLFGEGGFDELHGGSGADFMDGGQQADQLHGYEGNDKLFGGAGMDTADGADGNDRLFGQTENDRLFGGHDQDVIRGGAQEDYIHGGTGHDHLYGDGGFDKIDAGRGDDYVDGGGQADVIWGRNGYDTLLGGGGMDRIYGGAGHDTISGGEGDDTLFGELGDDIMTGDDGTDRLLGGRGNDRLEGGAGDDTLRGGAGHDILIGGAGDDDLTGDFNADTFVFEDLTGGFGHDIIRDFVANNMHERIDLSKVAEIVDFSDLTANHMAQNGADVRITVDADSSITISNTVVSDLVAYNFIF